jgi:hypothetical protein
MVWSMSVPEILTTSYARWNKPLARQSAQSIGHVASNK